MFTQPTAEFKVNRNRKFLAKSANKPIKFQDSGFWIPHPGQLRCLEKKKSLCFLHVLTESPDFSALLHCLFHIAVISPLHEEKNRFFMLYICM